MVLYRCTPRWCARPPLSVSLSPSGSVSAEHKAHRKSVDVPVCCRCCYPLGSLLYATAGIPHGCSERGHLWSPSAVVCGSSGRNLVVPKVIRHTCSAFQRRIVAMVWPRGGALLNCGVSRGVCVVRTPRKEKSLVVFIVPNARIGKGRHVTSLRDVARVGFAS